MNKDIDINDEYFDDYDYVSKEKKKTAVPLISRTWAKVVAFIVAIVMIFITIASVVGAVLMVSAGVYNTTQQQLKMNTYYQISHQDIYFIKQCIREKRFEEAKVYCEAHQNIYAVEIYRNNKKLKWDYKSEVNLGEVLKIENDFEKAVIYIYEEPIEQDMYMLADKLIDFAYQKLYLIYADIIIALILAVCAIVFLMCASGHRKGIEQIKSGWGTKVPFDLLTASLGVIFALFVFAVADFWNSIHSDFEAVVCGMLWVLVVLTASIFLTGWLMSLALRVKLGKWWKNTIIYYVLILLLWLLKAFVKILSKTKRNIFGYMKSLLKMIPFLWKAVMFIGLFVLLQFIMMVCTWYENDNMLICFIISTPIVVLLSMYCTVSIRKLQQATEALAKGDFNYQVNTEKLYGDFKKHGEAINSVAKGMTIAVEEKIKSERMKTELITNVSHDIKTPLTSIINYTNLIANEKCDNEKINEYSQVLLRQSDRLKKLIEDLVEVSKATTGNLKVDLKPCYANILIEQAVGEYQEKLSEKNITLITDNTEKTVMIMADSECLWRIFDNLMNNVYKYAQSNTRVYLSLEEQGENAVITLKNISQAPLNITSDELMERFVRGDFSRSTDGNGLGLSIAKSLAQLQNGTFEIQIDGDLFKAIIKFPKI